MVVAGDRSARFTQVYNDHVHSILAYAIRRVDEPADAADVVAETFLVAWRRLDDVPSGSSTRPWLFGVARRVLANIHRGRRRRRALVGRLRQGVVDEFAMADPADRVASDMSQRQLVRAALDQLSAADRDVLQLTAWEGLSPTEIGQVVGVPAATARSRLHRARQRLREAMHSEQNRLRDPASPRQTHPSATEVDR